MIWENNAIIGLTLEKRAWYLKMHMSTTVCLKMKHPFSIWYRLLTPSHMYQGKYKHFNICFILGLEWIKNQLWSQDASLIVRFDLKQNLS